MDPAPSPISEALTPPTVRTRPTDLPGVEARVYFGGGAVNLAGVERTGSFSEIEKDGRRGILAGSIHSELALVGGHTLDAPQGALTFWVLPMEDMAPGIWWGPFAESEPDCDRYPLLTSNRNRRDVMSASFSLAWQQFWWRPLMARFCSRQQDLHFRWWSHFGPCEFHFEGGCWYQLGLTWDREERAASLYANGVCLSRTDSWKRPVFEPAGDTLYAGSTAFALGELAFFGEAWSDEQFREAFGNQGTKIADRATAELKETFEGGGVRRIPPPTPTGYHTRLELGLRDPSDLEKFYVQGNRGAAAITPEGLLVQTPPGSPPLPEEKRDAEDMLQIYLHTWDTFCGDLYLEFEFKALAHAGLGLVMVQAQGMQGEDFMRDHPLRTTGSMRMICWENVRNYHWEFFREMEGIRNDVATHVFMKNPYFKGLAFQAMDSRVSLHEWHRACLVQEGGRWRGYLDDAQVFDVTDEAGHAGPVYRHGRVSLRNMRDTKMLWRNLKIATRPTDWKIVRPIPD